MQPLLPAAAAVTVTSVSVTALLLAQYIASDLLRAERGDNNLVTSSI